MQQTVPVTAYRQVLALEAARMGGLTLSKAVVSRYQRQVTAEAGRLDADPVFGSTVALKRRVYPSHPYRHPETGGAKALSRLSFRDVRRFYRTYFRPDNAVLVLVGPLAENEAREGVEAAFGDLKPGGRSVGS